MHTEGRAVARASPRRGYVTRKRTFKLQRKKSNRYAFASRRVAGGVLDGWMDVPTRLMMMMMMFRLLWTRPMGYLTVHKRSIREQNGIEGRPHPSVVSSNACAQKRASERTARWSVRARARVDGSIVIFSMHRFSSSALPRVGRIGRVGRPEDGWTDGTNHAALDARRGATRRRNDLSRFFGCIWRVVNRGFVRGSTPNNWRVRVRVRVRANAWDG